MLVNLKIKPGQRSKWQKFCRITLRNEFYNGRNNNCFRPYVREMKNHFNFIFRPYKPCGLEYVEDTMSDFVGVYVDTFNMIDRYIDAMTYNKVIESLIDYGCVDNASQAVEQYEKLKKDRPEKFVGNHVILLKPVTKNQNGGFRWRKHGGYIGSAPAGDCEYFDDEGCDLKMVYTYNILQISKAKEEDFGDVVSRNFGRKEGIRKLRCLGLTNLAAYAKTCGYVYCGDNGCWTGDQDYKEMYFSFDYDDNGNLIVTPVPQMVKPEKISDIPNVDWSK